MGKHLRFDTGAVTLELVIAFPSVLLAVLLTINAALWYHARNIALAAAQEGVRAGRAYDGNINNGRATRATAATFVRTTGGGFLLAPHVDTSGSTSHTVIVHVTGKTVSLIPGLHLGVSQVARGPVERFTSSSGSPASSGPSQ